MGDARDGTDGTGTSRLYHSGSRELQDRFESRRIADRLEAVTLHEAFTEADRAFIESAPFFFLATADAAGRPDCSFKGGLPGFARVTGPSEVTFPDYDGNGMFKSLGNIRVNPWVGLLFIGFGDKPRRLRVNGQATLLLDGAPAAASPGAQLLVRVAAHAIFPNCPRYIPAADGREPSTYSPRPGYEPPEPEWKSAEAFRDHVRRRGEPPPGGAGR